MATRIPNLWCVEKEAGRLYERYLCELSRHRQHERVVTACRQMRRYGQRSGMDCGFTFFYEIDALCNLKNYRMAWRQLRQWDYLVSGKREPVSKTRWSPTDARRLAHYYAPLLYFRGQFREGRKLLEKALDFWFQRKRVPSYDLLFFIYNGDEVPWDRCRVTLTHFYTQLDKSLLDWPHWKAFVRGFHPRLFRISGVKSADLLANPDLLPAFFEQLMVAREKRTTSGVTDGERDLVEDASEVRKRQKTIQRQRAEFQDRIEPVKKSYDQKLRELFPELRALQT